MAEPSTLDDPRYARFAWARFRKILWLIAGVSLLVGLAVAALLWWLRGPLPWVFLGMVVGGVFATIMMAAALMGLMFLSSGTGHDQSVEDPLSDDLLEATER
ncbi:MULTISPECIES: hypothetical protein [Sphingobium]|uniref:hypothetical protein n=1 Tax=Sphingobium TaxID=165695 RepID=UPI0015EBEEB4|nr:MULTISPECIES: hypothetical protein [Sphingobium]MCW2363193.1 Na+-driven multidrug efflux pump [Sphingobium sp. B10D3B]MCW2400127.1 Na+-driven multidrug efflux pump [Sphingobium sp. B10D7B]MCW2407105.1 Na+-driven multidrug efflux pump [Sphingobium xanthum]